ncbi:MAG: type II secretion system protein M [Gammaproteobacteria bacterium]|nr:type II secretion system protein M [Gammaproteobacteria bacterium]MCW8841146.1 type II secretion system protein M [Gammaproteobacteria bacterium]MCW8927627.1 type II secretion system protein M [Gammaproteobacteria bacterium]MCW8957629.1 type II secretion system protein M [Gammaproteobacteria bacterium]MCW8973000.1 type II secretion system protein M [Gammaproteobacteria bacterium]
MSHHVVRARTQRQRQLLMLAAVVVMVLLGWGLFEYGRYQGGFDRFAVREDIQAQRQRLDELADENARLREQRAIIERSGQIEQEAYKQLQGTVNGLQDELLELKEELAFYRGIVSPGDANKGLNLQSFELTPGRGARSFRFKMVLTQVLSTGTVAYGNIALSIVGTQEGADKEYTLAQLSDNSKGLQFRFKYFQAFEGDISLPEGFLPSKVNLVVKPRSRTHKQLTESVDWTVQES